MQLCLNQRTGEGCGALNHDSADMCRECGRPMRFALTIVNDIIAGRYRIIRGIGCGKFGAVYQVEDVYNPDSLLAVKESFDAENIRMFEREFEVLQNLQHPNLPRYEAMFVSDGSGYLVMEFIPGQSLADVLNQLGAVPEVLVLSYLVQIYDVLEYLHTRTPPIIHRDIKPTNIRLTPEGLIKLVDFGLLKRGMPQDTTTISGFSPGYAAPEQLMSLGGTGARSDIYGLGATLYHLLTGQVPMPALERLMIMPQQILSPQSINPNISPFLSDAILQAMEFSADKRYPDIPTMRQIIFGVSPALNPISANNASKVVEVECNAESGSYNIVWSPDSRLLAGTFYNGVCTLWDTHTDEMRYIRHGQEEVWGISFNPQGDMLAVASDDRTVKVWRVSDGTLLHVLEGHTRDVWRVAFSPDGMLLASASLDSTVKLWRTDDWQLVRVLEGHDDAVRTIAFSSDGLMLASGSRDATIKLWSVNTGELIQTIPKTSSAIFSIVFTPDDQVLASTSNDRSIKLWQVQDGTLVHKLHKHEGAVLQVDFAPDGQTLAAASADSTISLWRVSDGRLLNVLYGHENIVSSIAFAPDGLKLASASEDSTIRLWGAR
jgi:WD40 repeat protein